MDSIARVSQQTSSPDTANARQALRQKLKRNRQQLSPAEQAEAASLLVAQLLQTDAVKNAKRIAAYHSFGAELDTGPLLEALLASNKQLCLPVLHPFARGHLLMLDYDQHTPLRMNPYGIAEPVLDCRRVVPIAEIDCLLTPLVGFDLQGNRIGMGGGFYDRTLAGWAQGRYQHLQVIGLAHDCQQVASIPCEPWDVPLPMVITPTQCWRFA
ncbi:MAG: 5-formyltetrahydrofolate cyclo-ligase [Idiomarina sp.]|nr:5-formyltetrahydrofolate cyclo-ligase [Idiomarina sp.]